MHPLLHFARLHGQRRLAEVPQDAVVERHRLPDSRRASGRGLLVSKRRIIRVHGSRANCWEIWLCSKGNSCSVVFTWE